MARSHLSLTTNIDRVAYGKSAMRQSHRIIDKLSRKLAAMKHGGSKALIEIGVDILGDSVKLAPVDTGNLRSSGYINYPGADVSTQLSVYFSPEHNANVAKLVNDRMRIIAAGQSFLYQEALKGRFVVEVGHTAFYAMVQHEVQFKHNVGQWKFLETSIRMNLPKALGRLSAEVSKGMKA